MVLVRIPDGTAPEGRFLVEPTTGQVAWLEDPNIAGVVREHDGNPITRYDAPKTQVVNHHRRRAVAKT